MFYTSNSVKQICNKAIALQILIDWIRKKYNKGLTTSLRCFVQLELLNKLSESSKYLFFEESRSIDPDWTVKNLNLIWLDDLLFCSNQNINISRDAICSKSNVTNWIFMLRWCWSIVNNHSISFPNFMKLGRNIPQTQ